LVVKVSVTVTPPFVTGPPVLQTTIRYVIAKLVPLTPEPTIAFVIVMLGGPIRVVGAGIGAHWRQNNAPFPVP
jgi:hypothetical protein